MSEYIMKMKSYADCLNAIGMSVSDDDLTLNILTGLGSEYDSFVVSITT